MTVSSAGTAFIVFLSLCATGHAASGDPGRLRDISGVVQVQSRGAEGWVLVRRAPLELAAGDSVRTGYGARALIECADGTRLELVGVGRLTLRENSRYRVVIGLDLGPLRVWTKADILRSFQLRTPTALASVRGLTTELRAEVQLGGFTVIDLQRGLLGVEDRRGAAAMLHPNERLEIGPEGMGNPRIMPTAGVARRLRFRELMLRELDLDLAKEAAQSATARELELEQYQEGKALIDPSGNRVRVEEFVLRPAANEFKLVVLNGRASGLDYFYYLGTFNQALPRDLSIPLSQLPGRAGTAPDYWLTSFQAGWSNSRDTVVATGQGGHPVNVNNDGYAGDLVSWLFNPNTNSYAYVAGQDVYQTLFNSGGWYVNGALKYGWLPAAGVTNIQNSNQTVPTTANDPTSSTTYPQPNGLHQVVYESFINDGTYLRWDNTAYNYSGQTAAGDISADPAPAFGSGSMRFNFEQVVTASEFDGRSIDIVVAPRVLAQSRLLP